MVDLEGEEEEALVVAVAIMVEVLEVIWMEALVLVVEEVDQEEVVVVVVEDLAEVVVVEEAVDLVETKGLDLVLEDLVQEVEDLVVVMTQDLVMVEERRQQIRRALRSPFLMTWLELSLDLGDREYARSEMTPKPPSPLMSQPQDPMREL